MTNLNNLIKWIDDNAVPQTMWEGCEKKPKYYFQTWELVAKVQELAQQPQLNPDQEIVLENMKLQYSYEESFLDAVGAFCNTHGSSTRLNDAYVKLTDEQECQVLAAFAQWGQERSE